MADLRGDVVYPEALAEAPRGDGPIRLHFIFIILRPLIILHHFDKRRECRAGIRIYDTSFIDLEKDGNSQSAVM